MARTKIQNEYIYECLALALQCDADIYLKTIFPILEKIKTNITAGANIHYITSQSFRYAVDQAAIKFFKSGQMSEYLEDEHIPAKTWSELFTLPMRSRLCETIFNWHENEMKEFLANEANKAVK